VCDSPMSSSSFSVADSRMQFSTQSMVFVVNWRLNKTSRLRFSHDRGIASVSLPLQQVRGCRNSQTMRDSPAFWEPRVTCKTACFGESLDAWHFSSSHPIPLSLIHVRCLIPPVSPSIRRRERDARLCRLSFPSGQ